MPWRRHWLLAAQILRWVGRTKEMDKVSGGGRLAGGRRAKTVPPARRPTLLTANQNPGGPAPLAPCHHGACECDIGRGQELRILHGGRTGLPGEGNCHRCRRSACRVVGHDGDKHCYWAAIARHLIEPPRELDAPWRNRSCVKSRSGRNDDQTAPGRALVWPALTRRTRLRLVFGRLQRLRDNRSAWFGDGLAVFDWGVCDDRVLVTTTVLSALLGASTCGQEKQDA